MSIFMRRTGGAGRVPRRLGGGPRPWFRGREGGGNRQVPPLEARTRARPARPLLAALLLCSLAAVASAEESAAFLKIPVGARPVAMGSAFTAVADDINALSWNPAGLASLERRQFGATHAELFAGTRYDFLGLAMPTKTGAWGVSANLLTQGAIEGRDAAGRPSGSFTATDRAVGVGYAFRARDAVSLGAGVKYIDSQIAEASAGAFALDLGGLYRAGTLTRYDLPVTLGLAVQNLGRGMRFLDRTSPLPLTVSGGLSVRLPAGVGLAFDYRYRPHAEGGASEFGFGTEYAIFQAVALRAGYARAGAASSGTRPAGQSGVGAFSGLGAGLGLNVKGWTLDYAFTPFGELGAAQRVSLGFSF